MKIGIQSLRYWYDIINDISLRYQDTDIYYNLTYTIPAKHSII